MSFEYDQQAKKASGKNGHHDMSKALLVHYDESVQDDVDESSSLRLITVNTEKYAGSVFVPGQDYVLLLRWPVSVEKVDDVVHGKQNNGKRFTKK